MPYYLGGFATFSAAPELSGFVSNMKHIGNWAFSGAVYDKPGDVCPKLSR